MMQSFLYFSASDGGALSVHEPTNIGNPQERTVLDLARLILKLTGSKKSVEFSPLPIDDPQVRRPDITKAKALLEWGPKFDIEEGLTKTIEHFRNTLALNVASSD